MLTIQVKNKDVNVACSGPVFSSVVQEVSERVRYFISIYFRHLTK